ncbi:hypothetical protein F5X99DRAFT_430916 [Biscogniauxia marginata]|nr:hypothetical protein F5X99DRAFT_430916 [Biscogniauxia marginata]
MRGSIFKAAAAAFIVLNSVLLGTQGAVTKRDDAGTILSGKSVDVLLPRADVANPFTAEYGYRWQPKSYDRGVRCDTGKVYSDNYMRGLVPVNEFGYNAAEGRFIVFSAWNANEAASAGKLKLRQLIMGTWKHIARKNPEDLKSLLWLDIMNDGAKEAIDDALEEIDRDADSVQVPIRADGGGDEKDAFEKIGKDNPLGEGMKKMADEYMPGYKISEYYVDKRSKKIIHLEARFSRG